MTREHRTCVCRDRCTVYLFSVRQKRGGRERLKREKGKIYRERERQGEGQRERGDTERTHREKRARREWEREQSVREGGR